MDNHFQRHWLPSWIHGCRVLHSAGINSFSLPGRGKIQIAGWERELVIFSIKIIVQCFGVSFVFAWQKKKRNTAAQRTNFGIKIVSHYVLRLRWATVESLLSRRVKRQSQWNMCFWKKEGLWLAFKVKSALYWGTMKPLTRKQEVAPKGNRRDKKSKMHVFANHDHRWWWARDFYRVIADEGEAQKPTPIITLKK